MRLVTALILITLVLFGFTSRTKKKVVFFGDSITQAAVGRDGYITKLDSLAKDHSARNKSRKWTAYDLIGAGISGNRVEDLYKRVEKDVLSKDPDVVVIWIGVNDVWHKKFVTDSNKIKFSHHYTALVKRLKEKGIKVVMCTPGVIGEKKNKVNEMDVLLDECADSIRVIAKRTKSPLVDLRKEFLHYIEKNNPEDKRSGILTADGVHLNKAGNQFVAEKIYAVLRKKIK